MAETEVEKADQMLATAEEISEKAKEAVEEAVKVAKSATEKIPRLK